MKFCGATLDLEAAGQDALGLATAHDAVLHHLPDLQEPGAGGFVAAPVAFIASHHFGDADAVFLRQHQQVVTAVKGVGQDGGVGRDDFLLAAVSRHFVADDKAAADRVIRPFDQQFARRVEGRKAHAVGVKRQALAAEEDQVFRLVEGNRVFAQQLQFARANGVQEGWHLLHIDRVRLMARQAQKHRLVAAMALARRAERAVQL